MAVTLLDIIKGNAVNRYGIPLIDEVSRRTPIMSKAAFRAIKGTGYETVVQTGATNTAGSFRTLNQGVAAANSIEELRKFSTFPIQPRFHVDAQLAANSEDGAQAFIARKTKGILLTEFIAHETQMVYGAASGYASAAGYPGLIDAYDPVNMVTDAGGTTANTGSSVWLVRFDPDSVQGILANGGEFVFGPLRLESILDPNDSTKTKYADTYVQTLLAQVGLQVTNVLQVARIKKITADSGHTLTDKLIMDTITLFKKMGPNAIIMNRRSIGQLRDSRTATNPTGTEAPFPTSVMGMDQEIIPIWVSEGILNTESLTL
jgi:hypothetical protein